MYRTTGYPVDAKLRTSYSRPRSGATRWLRAIASRLRRPSAAGAAASVTTPSPGRNATATPPRPSAP